MGSFGISKKFAAVSALVASVTFLATMPRASHDAGASLAISTPPGPYVGGGVIPIEVSGTNARLSVSAVGPGTIVGNRYRVPAIAEPLDALVVAAVPNAFAIATLHLVPPPQPGRALVAVAAYESGIVLHDPKTFHVVGIVPIEGAPGDVAFGAGGTIYAPDTDGTQLFRVDRAPWGVSSLPDVMLGSEVAVDAESGAVFVSNRDVEGRGAVTRLLHGENMRVITGTTAEGLIEDVPRRKLYVGNINSDDVVEIDADSMRILRRFHTLPRPFGLALDGPRRTLAVVSNENAEMPERGGYVATYRLDAAGSLLARSARLSFPVGIALDASRQRYFVTDEDDGVVYVLDERTLKPRHAPLRACGVPWMPHVDAATQRLLVPCARTNAIAVFDLQTLRQISGSPFPTGRYPLSVALSG
ncbi:MAG: hypothetical protein JOZ38_09230 [Candidatus Eremiobacteraeota bacterium]|nr:hypothetical protein [Candidatus Eremiobacteraeota bacterium]